jgi:hypothetical protein
MLMPSNTIKPAHHPMELKPRSNAAKGLMMIAMTGVVLVVSAIVLTTPNEVVHAAGRFAATNGAGSVADR